jgi:hypothetical protein
VGLGGLGSRDTVRGKEVHELGFGRLEAERAKGDAQFVVVEVMVAVKVEEGELSSKG